MALGALPATAISGSEAWREEGRVERVVDGDTFDMRLVGGEVQRVRINGIQAPESKWCGGKEATAALRELLPEGTPVRLSSIREASGNAPGGVWRLKRTVHTEVGGVWTDVAPGLVSRGIVFPFPFIGEDAHNDEYLALALQASQQRIGLYNPGLCGPEASPEERLRLEVVPDGPGSAAVDAEFVLIYNGSGADVDLSGWMVQDTSPLNAFFFPEGAVVRADDFVVVFSGSGTQGVAPDGSADNRYFYSGHGRIWNNDTTEIAFLFDNVGKRETGNLREWSIVTREG
jgi:endonuclease YncB( thermonuclease family)